MDIYQKEELKNTINVLKTVFSVVRIVDPIEQTVPFTEGIEKTPAVINCYEYWQKGKVCENCISKQAINEDKVITKIEYNDKGAFLVIGKPIIMDNKKYTIEMLLTMEEIDTIEDLDKENSKKIQGVITNLKENLITDDLTGVYNRRFINTQLPADIENGKKNGINKLSVIMVDIDNFKEINDFYGHLMGDKALQKIANIIKNRIRSDYDWVARFGGDEFIILLKNADEGIAKHVIKSIQTELVKSNFMNADQKVKITLSFGIHIIEPGTVDSKKVLEIIDKNLSMAKDAGKNRAIIS